ncbi:RNA-binding protein 42-like isoform X1 [Sinocyclocheilus rhinocerous]|uniref:RNA-binding protein 42 n=1 Tax=Sinocyclocheilus rhinocerous TaxID=307959 RepID=A0A673IHZ7_9TELE|nr:PREDICTED: RNA-binding protein 42-like isoform X1 [Sinocyclocheilus rhinocerous]XP_016394159.1 PREDICTED: RNA-binding protein 42-like isoform X1 [Sinocyclocheilus rhinocerous]XP_016394160.1 PREDICTED: RNA-binding protein 42-like isoform X1 [Sinocyclocheilus rhinocerous]XP_016394161.1 PREDICTED: RNA-binding protein 42-like isoform X1 [Sinocyclocheilus rhinocerous]
MALKSGEERLKEMEAEMALFEQEVLGGPVAPTVVEAVPVALAMPAVPIIRPIIGTNTYREVQLSLDARAATFVGPPPTFVGPAMPAIAPPPMMRPAFVPHVLQRPGGQRMPLMRGPPPQGMIAPPLPRPPPPPPMMMAPPMSGPPQPPMAPVGPPMGPMPLVGSMNPMTSAPPRPMPQDPPKISPSVIQAAPTVYTAPPAPKRTDFKSQKQARMEELSALVAEQQAAVMAAGLLESKKEAVTDDSVIGPSMPEPEPTHVEPAETSTEDKKKGKQEKVKKCIRVAAGVTWEDTSLSEWDSDDFRIFCGDLGNEVNDDILARAFSRYPSFLKAKVVRDKRTGKTKGYGFVSFKDPNEYVRAMREMNGRYVGSRPIKLRKSSWKDRNLEVVRKKQKEKKKLGLR